MKHYQIIIGAILISSSLLLSACQNRGDNANKEVSRFVTTVENAAKKNTGQQMQKKFTVQPIAYEGNAYRDPFELPAAVKNIKKYPNAILGDTALDTLKLVGIILHGNERWALFRANNGKMYKMTEGMRVGVQQALLTEISNNQVKFTVDVDSEQGGKPQEVTMTLQEPMS